MCKDGSKMGIGCPEYVLLFRKLPTDTSRAYADQPVKKDKSEYSLARWQIDAHASWKSSGNLGSRLAQQEASPQSKLYQPEQSREDLPF